MEKDIMFENYKRYRSEQFRKLMAKSDNNSLDDKIFKLIAQFKVYFQNSTSYLAMANFIMILATFKHSYNINIPLLIIGPLGLGLFLIVGYIDYKLIYLKQATYINKQNDVKHQLDRIEKLLGEKK